MFEKLFGMVGAKLKAVAKVLCVMGICASAIFGIVMMTNDLFIQGIITIPGGAVSAWISALGLYAFGELVENSDIRTNLAIKADLEREREKKSE